MDSKAWLLGGSGGGRGAQECTGNSEGIQSRKQRWEPRKILVLFVLVCIWLWGGRCTMDRAEVSDLGEKEADFATSTGLRWSQISPSSDIIWYKCYEQQYDCARLTVPLDWLNPSDPRRVTIAMIRYNATELDTYAGPVFINPGGPGGSGVWFVKHLAPHYQTVVGKNHDIISFDPRGVGSTSPSISCWNTSSTSPSPSAYIWDLKEPPVLDAHPGAVYDAYAHAAAFSQQCHSQISDIGQYVSTASVARDMLHMVEKLSPSERQPKLKYWGFSYGTFLGVTFASLFPDRVGRMVNDGNVDAGNYVSGRGSHFLEDTDRVMDAFYFFCHQAGPNLCDFHAESPDAIRARLDALLDSIKRNPVVVPAWSPSNPTPEIISYSRVRRLISTALYRPVFIFPNLASSLLALESGDGRPFVDLTSQGGDGLPPLCSIRLDNPDPTSPENPAPEMPEMEGSGDASKANQCSEWDPMQGGVEGFATYVDELVGLSSAAGATMASLVIGCVGWKVQAKWRFTGPFASNTSHPVLFVANTADNVTPLRSALANAAGFPGSVVMIQDSYGHTTLSTPSRCTARKIRAYFQTGEMPPNGTICAPDLVPFKPWTLDSSSKLESRDENDYDLDVAMRGLMMAPVGTTG